jgi:hypothetical protein
VRGGDPRTGSGPVMRYMVEVEAGIVIARLEFARLVHSILGHPKSWAAQAVFPSAACREAQSTSG